MKKELRLIMFRKIIFSNFPNKNTSCSIFQYPAFQASLVSKGFLLQKCSRNSECFHHRYGSVHSSFCLVLGFLIKNISKNYFNSALHFCIIAMLVLVCGEGGISFLYYIFIFFFPSFKKAAEGNKYACNISRK